LNRHNSKLWPPLGPLRAAIDTLKGRPPQRYYDWDDPFRDRLAQVLAADLRGEAILDIGAGPNPTVPMALRPAQCRYVGLDVSAAELSAATPGSYDAIHVADVTRFSPDLEGQFAVALSFHALEHVKSVAAALENIRRYLRPGGVFLAQLSGRWSNFGVLGRALPHAVTRRILVRTHGRDEDSVFPAYYDRCYKRALDGLLAPWTAHEVVPSYISAGYLNFSRPLFAAGVLFDDSMRRAGWADLASHYVIRAVC
jgi:SAM-dependent methyltransferase